MYVTSYDGLMRALDERRTRFHEARASVNAFVRRRYGLDHMMEMADEMFSGHEVPVAVLARQIASICVEDVAFVAGARRMGLTPLTLTFTRDAFTKNNHDKLNRVKVPWVSWSKKGNLVRGYDRIVRESNDALERVPLDRIRCVDGTLLPDYHTALRKTAGIVGAVDDVFTLDRRILSAARNRPAFVYREVGGREVRYPIDATTPLESRDRPPAEWYYPYYLSWFIDGTFVLFETYDNPMGEVSHAKAMFEGAMREVASETGFVPLIVKVPALSKEMLYCNRHLMQPDAFVEVSTQAKRHPMDDTVTFFRNVAETVTNFR
jgi:hypothetical protein